MGRENTFKAQEQLTFTYESTKVGVLLDSTDFIILLDSVATNRFTSENYYIKNKSVHGLPESCSKVKVIHGGNGASVNIKFFIPIRVTNQSHMSQVSTMVSEIHE